MSSYQVKYVSFKEGSVYDMDNTVTCENYSSLLMGKSLGQQDSLSDHRHIEHSAMFLDYPPNKPFINDEYERPSYKPVKSYPEGNRKAVLTALRNLQEKIHQLDDERTSATDNLRSLASETIKCQDILEKENDLRCPKQTVSKHNKDLESQLSAAESQSTLLEKQLQYMRHMVRNADKKHSDSVKTSAAEIDITPESHTECTSAFKDNLRKIAELEQEHQKLTANQSFTECKIRELEDKISEERNHCKRMEKPLEIEFVQEANMNLQNGLDIEEYKVPQKAKKKKKKKSAARGTTSHCHKSDSSKHYHLSLNDIPFVAGKNTGPSHSVGANVQRVFSLMKYRNAALCSSTSSPVESCHKSRVGSSRSVSPATETDLAEILLQLQDEFHKMSFEHEHFLKEIKEATDRCVRNDLENELDTLVSRMEAKNEQISKIRKYQAKLAGQKKKTKASHESDSDNSSTPRLQSACARASLSSPCNGKADDTTTIKTKGSGKGIVQIRPSSKHKVYLNVLKDMKQLQCTLQKSELC